MTLEYRFDAARPDSLWLVRQLCDQWLREHHVRADAVTDLLLVVTELCTDPAPGDVVVRVSMTNSDVEVEVEMGERSPLSVAGDEAPTPGGDLRLAAALVDELVLKVSPAGTVARCRRHDVLLV